MKSFNMQQKSELHLVILWANARYKESEIITDITQHVDIVDAYDVHWSCDHVAENFTRFYGVNLPSGSVKETECGIEGFLLLIVRDNHPKYEYVETSRGTEKVNINIFSMKQKYRSWTGGGHKIHTTNSIKETNHDSTLLLGLNYEDLQKALPEQWDGNVKTIYRDLVGANGWKDLKEFFYVLNATVDYMVLRNSEILPDEFKSNLHGDIDILTNDYVNLSFIANATPVFKEDYRVHNKVIINNTEVFFDFRFLGDNYYCYNFEKDLLQYRNKNKKDIYVPDDNYAFYSLIYHALIHKQVIAPDYYDKIYDLFVKLGLNKRFNLKDYASPFDLYYELLENFMIRNNYEFIKPNDKSVFYSEKFVNSQELQTYLVENYNFTDIHLVHTDVISRAYNLYLSAVDEYGNKQFIKSGDIPYLYKNEYEKSKRLWDIDNTHFLKPMYYHDDLLIKNSPRFVALEFTDATNLRELLASNKLTTEQKSEMLDDILAIFNALSKSGIVHRDIHDGNLVYHNGHLVLIDFQLAVEYNNYHELKFLTDNPQLLMWLGTEKYRQQPYHWDDAYSLLKVLEYVGFNDKYAEKYNHVYSVLQNAIGKRTIIYNHVTKKSRKIYKVLSKILPVKSWRKHFRKLYKK